VRELRNLIERALILCEGDVIEPRHLSLGPPPTSLSSPPRRGDPLGAPSGLRDEVKTLERQRIEAALLETQGNQRLAAEKLGLSRGALLRRLELLGMPRPRKGS
jgi:DNA-binding NtrC family response regulator